MSAWFAHDMHLDHDSIRIYAERPWPDVQSMNEGLAKNWNDVVHKHDTVYVSDFAFRNHAQWLARLKGNKVLVTGSHDKMHKDVLRMFADIFTAKMITVAGQPIWCQHTCCRVWERCHYGSWHVFGHSHARMPTWNLSTDGGIDVNKRYRPYHEDELKAEMTLRAEGMRAMGRVVFDRGRELWRQDDVRFWIEKAGVVPGEIGLHE